MGAGTTVKLEKDDTSRCCDYGRASWRSTSCMRFPHFLIPFPIWTSLGSPCLFDPLFVVFKSNRLSRKPLLEANGIPCQSIYRSTSFSWNEAEYKNKRMVHDYTLLLPIYTTPRYHPHVPIMMIEILKNRGEKWRPESGSVTNALLRILLGRPDRSYRALVN